MLSVVCFLHVQLYRVAHLHQSPAAALISMVLVAHTAQTHARTLAHLLQQQHSLFLRAFQLPRMLHSVPPPPP